MLRHKRGPQFEIIVIFWYDSNSKAGWKRILTDRANHQFICRTAVQYIFWASQFLYLWWEKTGPKVLFRGSGPKLKLLEIFLVMVTFRCSHAYQNGMLCILQLIQNRNATSSTPELYLDFQMSNYTVNGNIIYKFSQLIYSLWHLYLFNLYV